MSRREPPPELPPKPGPVVTERPALGLRWKVIRGTAAVEALAGGMLVRDWDQLAQSTSPSPTADAIWTRCFWSAFGEDDDALALHAAYRGDRLVGMLPLRRQGRVLQRWASISNAHSPRCSYALDTHDRDIPAGALEHLLNDVDMIDIERIPPDDPLVSGVLSAAEEQRLRVDARESGGDHVIELRSPWDECRRALPSKMVRETSRKLRQLEAQGTLEFNVVRAEPDMSRTLSLCFELEMKGWKGDHGSPIAASPRTLTFYSRLAQEESAAGRFALYVLKFEGRLVAYELCLRAQGRIEQLKPSYDPALRRYSPGNILRYRVLEHEVARGEVTTYHLGDPATWKYHWAKRVDPLVRLRVFRASVPAAAHWGSLRARDLVHRSAALRRLSAGLRRVGLRR